MITRPVSRFGLVSLVPLTLVLLLGGATPAGAQQAPSSWYAGLGATHLRVRFEPRYESLVGGTPDVFVDRADGFELDILGGRRQRLNDRVSLAVQASVGRNSVAWTLQLPDEPASFKYSLPYAVTLSALPDVHLGAGISAFLEVGGGLGRVREMKVGPRTSAYDFDQLQWIAALGGGLRYQLTRSIDLTAAYRSLSYEEGRFDSLSPASTPVEHVRDTPRATALVFAATSRF